MLLPMPPPVIIALGIGCRCIEWGAPALPGTPLIIMPPAPMPPPPPMTPEPVPPRPPPLTSPESSGTALIWPCGWLLLLLLLLLPPAAGRPGVWRRVEFMARLDDAFDRSPASERSPGTP